MATTTGALRRRIATTHGPRTSVMAARVAPIRIPPAMCVPFGLFDEIWDSYLLYLTLECESSILLFLFGLS